MDAGFSAVWNIRTDDGLPLTCERIRAERVVFEIEDAKGAVHRYEAPCTSFSYESPEWEVAVGRGTVTASLYREGDDPAVLATADALEYSFVSGKTANRLPNFSFTVIPEVLSEAAPLWTVTIALNDRAGDTTNCARMGIGFISVTFLDAEGRMYEVGSMPCRASAKMIVRLDEPPAEGLGEMEIAFRAPSYRRVWQWTVGADAPLGDAVFDLSVPISMYSLGGDASLTWQWRKGEDVLHTADCERLEIDYGRVFIRALDTMDSWWSAPGAADWCPAYDRTWDDETFGTDAYSGVYNGAFLPAGDYTLSSVLFRMPEEDDPLGVAVAARFDVAVPGGDSGLDGTLIATGEGETNLLVSDLAENPQPRGELLIKLDWENAENGLVGNCETAGVPSMGLLLLSEVGPATTLKLSTTRVCRDEILFSKLPRLEDTPYTLIVYGINMNGNIDWYDRCGALLPELLEEGETPSGYNCLVRAELPTD